MVRALFAILLSCTFVLAQRRYFPQQAEDIPLSERQFRVVYEWRVIDFAYKTENDRGRARQSGQYMERNVLISDVKAFAGRLYLTMPRMLPGVPATLGWVVSPDNNGRTDPLVEPFPSWEMNEEGNCDAAQFVQGIAIDSDGIMWVIDSGRIHTLQQQDNSLTCPPKLLLLDLKRNGTIIHRYEFPEDVVKRGTNYLNKIVVDDAFGDYAYITDNSGSDPGIVVYSREMNRSWKIRENNSMRAAANAMDFAVNGTNLRFSIHIDGIALGPYYNPKSGDSVDLGASKVSVENYERNVYYCPLSSYHLYSLPASLLRDPNFALQASPRDVFNAVIDYGLKASQTDGMIMDNRGVLYYGLLKEHAIAQWDSYQPFTPNNQHIVAKDNDFIHWIDGMSFDENGYLFVVVNRLHNFVAGRLNPTQVNFRILRAKTGGLSYVFTNGPSTGNVDINLLHQGEFSGNGISSMTPFQNGISSTTPFYNSLEGRESPYSSSASSKLFNGLNLLGAIIIAVFQGKVFNFN